MICCPSKIICTLCGAPPQRENPLKRDLVAWLSTTESTPANRARADNVTGAVSADEFLEIKSVSIWQDVKSLIWVNAARKPRFVLIPAISIAAKL